MAWASGEEFSGSPQVAFIDAELSKEIICQRYDAFLIPGHHCKAHFAGMLDKRSSLRRQIVLQDQATRKSGKITVEMLTLAEQHWIPLTDRARSNMQSGKELTRLDFDGHKEVRTITFHYLGRSRGVSEPRQRVVRMKQHATPASLRGIRARKLADTHNSIAGLAGCMASEASRM